MNPILELRDIHLSPPPSFWPPAPGWWALTLLVLLVLAALSWPLLLRYRHWRRCRLALQLLSALRKALENDGDVTRFVAELSMLLRRSALSRFPDDNVAGLKGADWLGFLDSTGGGGEFADGPGQLLLTIPYAPSITTPGVAAPGAELDVDGLYALARQWLASAQSNPR